MRFRAEKKPAIREEMERELGDQDLSSRFCFKRRKGTAVDGIALMDLGEQISYTGWSSMG